MFGFSKLTYLLTVRNKEGYYYLVIYEKILNVIINHWVTRILVSAKFLKIIRRVDNKREERSKHIK